MSADQFTRDVAELTKNALRAGVSVRDLIATLAATASLVASIAGVEREVFIGAVRKGWVDLEADPKEPL